MCTHQIKRGVVFVDEGRGLISIGEKVPECSTAEVEVFVAIRFGANEVANVSSCWLPHYGVDLRVRR